MKTIIELSMELSGGVVLLFVLARQFARLSRNDEFFKDTFFEDENENLRDENSNDFIHHVSI
ncbi:MAG: hypothetical protein WCK78_14750 [Paludibacter sp.]